MHANTASSLAIEIPTAIIIPFPTQKRMQGVTQDPAEILKRLDDMRHDSIEDAHSFLLPSLLEAITHAGFSLENERLTLLLIELIRTILADHFGYSTDLSDFINLFHEEIDSILDNVPEVADSTAEVALPFET